MRTFLAARLLENIAYNGNRGTKNLRLFEVGKVFFRSDESLLPRESMHLACAISGKEREYFWRDTVKDFDFFDLKGVLEGLFERFNLRLRVVKAESPFLESAMRRRPLRGRQKSRLDRGAPGEREGRLQRGRNWYGAASWTSTCSAGAGPGKGPTDPYPVTRPLCAIFPSYVPDRVPVADLIEEMARSLP